MTSKRDEPTLGSIDLSEVEFRRPRPPSSRADYEHPYAGLWWRIALGVFTALLAHSIVTGLYVRWEIYTGIKALGVAFEEWEKEVRSEMAAPPRSPRPASTQTSPPRLAMRPLAAGERCVGGKRFRRVENGWVQVMEPCR